MSIASVSEVRVMGRLPDASKLADAVIQPHLDSAVSDMKRLIGSGYESSTGGKYTACKEAEICFAIANLLPVMNTFYPQEVTVVQKQIGETDFLFSGPENMLKLVEYWKQRGLERIEGYLKSSYSRTVYWGEV